MYQPISLKFIMVQPFVTSLQEKIWFHVCFFFFQTLQTIWIESFCKNFSMNNLCPCTKFCNARRHHVKYHLLGIGEPNSYL